MGSCAFDRNGGHGDFRNSFVSLAMCVQWREVMTGDASLLVKQAFPCRKPAKPANTCVHHLVRRVPLDFAELSCLMLRHTVLHDQVRD